MARKTNKTAHVLNLITNPAPADEEPSIDMPNTDVSSIDVDVNVDVLDAKNTSSDLQSKTDTPKASSNHPQTPVVEILYNEHDPLSDIIKNVLEETVEEPALPSENTESIEDDSSVENANIFEYNLEFDDDGNEISSENIDSTKTPSNDLSSDSKKNTEINSDNINSEDNANDVSEVKSDLISENNANEDTLDSDKKNSTDLEDDTIESTIESAIESAIEKESANSNTPSSLLEKLEYAKNNHFHDRTDLNSMIDLDFKYVNVYERIVQDKLLDYMKKFDMCMCDRCIVDTFALAVTELPTKIVVVDKDEVFPLINFFEVKNTAIVSTALIKACMVVKEKPHHK